MKKLLAIGVLLAAVFAVTLAVIPQQDLDAIPCCEGAFLSTQHWTNGPDCATAEAQFRADRIGEAQAACSPTFPCNVQVPACYFAQSTQLWTVDGKLSFGCRETCDPEM